jgi:hypothetical protein
VTERLDVKPTKSKQLPPPRVRREPPTIEEAAFAAVGLTDDLDQQVDIAASLMGVSPDEAKPHVLNVVATTRAVAPSPLRAAAQLTIRDRVVTVERTGVRRVVLPPRTARVSR